MRKLKGMEIRGPCRGQTHRARNTRHPYGFHSFPLTSKQTSMTSETESSGSTRVAATTTTHIYCGSFRSVATLRNNRHACIVEENIRERYTNFHRTLVHAN